MSEYDIRGNTKITTIRFNDSQVINIDESNNLIEIEDEGGSTITIQNEDIQYFVLAIEKAKENLDKIHN